MAYRSEFITADWIGFKADSLGDVLAYLDSTPNLYPKHGQPSETIGDAAFHGTESMHEAKMLARFGWPEGRAKMRADVDLANLLRQAAPTLESELSVAGAYPDSVEYAVGNPCCMVLPADDDMRAKPVYRIVVNASYMSSIEASAITNRGAAILSYIDKLEAAGNRVELIMLRSCVRNGKKFSMTFPVKHADEALDLDLAAFVFANPAMLRRIGFGVIERHKPLHAWLGTQYRSCNDIPDEWKEERAVYFPAMTGYEHNEQYATMEKALETAGAIIEAAIEG